MPNPKVIDISHFDNVLTVGVTPFDHLKLAGIIGVIHKATQGANVDDHAYIRRRQWAKDQGLLWGAYHFNTGADVNAQVEHFLRAASPDDQTLMALDFEDNAGGEMSVESCANFLQLLDARLGRKAVLYSGNRIKELLPDAHQTTQDFIASHNLWLAEYTNRPKLPEQWEKYFLWQFTGDGEGPMPHAVPGVIAPGGIDINHYDGTDEQLREEWVT